MLMNTGRFSRFVVIVISLAIIATFIAFAAVGLTGHGFSCSCG
ncbi:MAG: hypothetical protein PHC61_07415 [Chitinivibrionales bacterium]|nr:hypothetical protein [Chitinivibrionales bacterium]